MIVHVLIQLLMACSRLKVSSRILTLAMRMAQLLVKFKPYNDSDYIKDHFE